MVGKPIAYKSGFPATYKCITLTRTKVHDESMMHAL